MPYMEMKFDPSSRIGALCNTAIGREPVRIAITGSSKIQIEFDPPLDNTEKITLRDALPPWVRMLWTFEEKEGTLSKDIT